MRKRTLVEPVVASIRSLARARVRVARLLSAVAVVGEGVLGLSTGYLLALLGAAAIRRPRPPRAGTGGMHLVVLIPAHNEERGIAETLQSVFECEYPEDRRDIVVIADNCDDRTAAVAETAGATVFRRTDPARRGKGHALGWGLPRVLAEMPGAEAIVLLDADCRASRNLLTAVAARLGGGAVAVQAQYVVSNPEESWLSGLRFAAFVLFNTVRPLGKDTLGLSCGLLGTGMAFARELLHRQPWEAFSLSEDLEYHARLVAAGERVSFAPEAWVSSPMPTSLDQARDQQLRWEGGRWQFVRTWTPVLVADGLRMRDPVRLHAGVEPLVPPQSLLLAGNAVLAVLALVSGSRLSITLAACNVVAQVCYIIGGLLHVRAPLSAYRSLALAPVLLASKVGIHAKILMGRGAKGWVATRRHPAGRQSSERPVGPL